MKQIYFDLDGVIRDTCREVLGYYPHQWDCYGPDGRPYCQIIEDNLRLLYTAPVTQYHEVIKKLPFVNILTCQPESWRDFTCCWLYEHFEFHQFDVIFVNHADEKLKILKPGDVLIEDYPLFSDYSQIALIDYPYNREVKGEIIRIHEPEELDAFLIMQRSSIRTQPQDIVLNEVRK